LPLAYFFRSRRGVRPCKRQKDRADFVFYDSRRIDSAVTKIGECFFDVSEVEAQLIECSTPDGVLHCFTWTRMTTNGVGPDPWPCLLREGTPGDQHLPGFIEYVTREGEMEWGLRGVDGRFLGGAHLSAAFVEKDY
jgi:hypothetical protein